MFHSMDPCGKCISIIFWKHRTGSLKEHLALIVPFIHQVDGDAALFLSGGQHGLMDMLNP